jgi:hypothetical protein
MALETVAWSLRGEYKSMIATRVLAPSPHSQSSSLPVRSLLTSPSLSPHSMYVPFVRQACAVGPARLYLATTQTTQPLPTTVRQVGFGWRLYFEYRATISITTSSCQRRPYRGAYIHYTCLPAASSNSSMHQTFITTVRG